jgi:hypothetical protein
VRKHGSEEQLGERGASERTVHRTARVKLGKHRAIMSLLCCDPSPVDGAHSLDVLPGAC